MFGKLKNQQKTKNLSKNFLNLKEAIPKKALNTSLHILHNVNTLPS